MSASAIPREGSRGELPLIDIHARAIDAPPERVWDVIADPFLPRFGGRAGPLIARLLGCSQVERPPAGGPIPPAVVGFRVAEALRPSLIALEGEHRFSRYALTFRIEPSGATTSRLSAETRARFPGISGSLYRAAATAPSSAVCCRASRASPNSPDWRGLMPSTPPSARRLRGPRGGSLTVVRHRRAATANPRSPPPYRAVRCRPHEIEPAAPKCGASRNSISCVRALGRRGAAGGRCDKQVLRSERADFLREAVALMRARTLEAEIWAEISRELGKVAPGARTTHRGDTNHPRMPVSRPRAGACPLSRTPATAWGRPRRWPRR